MFDWSNVNAPILVKLPFEIYWGTTGFITLVLAIGLVVLLMKRKENTAKPNQIENVRGPTNIVREASGSQVKTGSLQSSRVNNGASIGGDIV
jgi:hypothetical protein